MATTTETIYLDHNGSAPLAPEVIEAMRPWAQSCTGNPASGHSFGRKGKEAIEQARSEVAMLLGCSPAEIVFTSGGTESNNLALKGLAEAKQQGGFVASAVEHPSVLATCRYLATRGFPLEVAPVDSEGVVELAALESLVATTTLAVSVMLANNEVGTFQPIRQIADIAHRFGALMHCDAAQVLGKEPVNVEELGIDLLTIAGHKLNAPKGVGALYIRKGVTLMPQLHGAGHEGGLRSGTQDVLEIVGLGAAARRFCEQGKAITATYRELRDHFEQELFTAIPSAVLNGSKEQRLVNTTNVSFPGITSGELLQQCPQIACAAGAACHKDHTTPSHVLSAMGMPFERIASSLRFSLGFGTTKQMLSAAVQQLSSNVHVASSHGT